jgi:heme/copper-type cytochrome/quinol oxidase subunit 3
MTDAQRDPRSFGMWLFLIANALFFGALVYIYAHARSGLAVWPDVPARMQVSATLPLLAAGVMVLSALLLRARYHLLFPLLGSVIVPTIVALLWRRTEALGLTPASGKYGLVYYGFTGVWMLHVAGASVALAVRYFRSGGRAAAPLLARYFDFLALMGIVICVAVFLW